MAIQPANVSVLTKEITIEILSAFGLPKGEFWQNTIGPLFSKPATRFSEIFARFDQDIAELGLVQATRNLLTVFVEQTRAIGSENVPKEGPLLVTSNHPGTVDGLSIVANSGRDDFKVLVGGMPFLKYLPVAAEHLIYSHRDDQVTRANAVRASIRHLEKGGALLIFPSGQIDPDPAVLPGAREALDQWSKSVALMLRRVPETLVLPTITSGVLAERFIRSPLTFIKRDGVSKRRIMEFLQIMRQLLIGERFGLKPFVTFDEPISLQDIGGRRDADEILRSIIERAKELLNEHIAMLPFGDDRAHPQFG